MERNRPLGWTTFEEAKRFVDAGLDPNSADMCYLSFEDFYDKNFQFSVVIAREYKEIKRETKEFDYVPCWSLGALIKISVKIIENDYYFLSSAKDCAYSHLLNSVRELMKKYDNIIEATVCFLLGLLKRTIRI